MRRIEIDDEVYAELERHVRGFENPNDVLRRLLLGETRQAEVESTASRKGKLLPLIEARIIKPGDKLIHKQPRKGNTFEAEVSENGWLITTEGVYQAPSPALAALVGSQIDGWANWVHLPTGKTLRQLRG